MIQSFINTITPLIANTDSVQFDRDCIRTNGCNNWLCHNQGSANYDIVCGGLYEITFNASVSSATAGVVAFALFNNGEEIVIVSNEVWSFDLGGDADAEYRSVDIKRISETVKWLNKNHFDWRGLIPMGLAEDATNKNIY